MSTENDPPARLETDAGSEAPPPGDATTRTADGPGRPRTTDWWERHPRLRLARDVLAVLATVATIVGVVLTVIDRSRESGSEPVSDGASTISSDVVPSPGATGAPPAGEPGVGTCLASDAGEPVSCATAHRYEIFAVDDCSQEALVRYLGGTPGVEDVRVVPTSLALGDRPVCVLAAADGQPLTAAAQGALQGEGHSAWRTCLDARVGGAVVPCSQEHTGEVVRPLPGTDPADCEAVSVAYSNARVSDDTRLQVLTLQEAEGPRCLVQTRGPDLLDRSLRNIGSASLPFVQP